MHRGVPGRLHLRGQAVAVHPPRRVRRLRRLRAGLPGRGHLLRGRRPARSGRSTTRRTSSSSTTSAPRAARRRWARSPRTTRSSRPCRCRSSPSSPAARRPLVGLLTGALPDFPWDTLTPYADRARAHPGGIVDLSVGTPVDPTPAAAARGARRRRGRPRLPDDARHARAAPGGRRLVRPPPRRTGPRPGRRPADRGLQGARRPAAVPARARRGRRRRAPARRPTRPTTSAPGSPAPRPAPPTTSPTGARACGWSGSTRRATPTARCGRSSELRAVVTAARAVGAVVASDECYAELAWEEPWASGGVPSVLDPRVSDGDPTGLLAVYSLSKQSNLAGYRAAFAAGDPRAGRRAARGAQARRDDRARAGPGRDDGRARRRRARRRAARAVPRPARRPARGARRGGPDGGRVARPACTCGRGPPPGRPTAGTPWGGSPTAGCSWRPGAFYGEAAAGHVRVALTATDERVAEAARRLRG